MNFDDIQKTWQSPHNRPDRGELDQLKMNMITDLRKRRRSHLGLLVITLLPLLFVTFKIAHHLIAPNPALDPVDLSREWAIVPFFLLPWVGWLILARVQRSHHRNHAHYDRSLQASVAALLDENRVERLRYRLVTALMILSVPALAIVVCQLRSVGKTGDEILLPAFVIYPLYVLIVIFWSGYHHRRKTLPRQRELESLMAQYGANPVH